MGLEREIKLAASEDALDALERDKELCGMTEKVCVLSMRTTYFDTAEGDLSARHWMLRVRTENGEAIVTFKTAAKELARGEWEYSGTEPDAEKLIALGAPRELRELLKKPLLPVCGARFTRRAAWLRLSDGTRAELALDRGVLFRGERETPLCEAELEWKKGEFSSVLALSEELQGRFALTPETRSKFARAIALG